jgi:hypothetical protein
MTLTFMEYQETVAQLQAIEKRRPTWAVTSPVGLPLGTCPPTLQKVLSLRGLELDVKDWTLTAIEKLDMDSTAFIRIRDILESHSQDEDKHDRQLDLLAGYWGATGYVDGSLELQQRWEQNQSHPLAKKLALEAMVLFQCMALMLVAAPSDLFTQSVRQWILFDESAHVASARVLVKVFGVRLDRELLALGVDTVKWLTSDLGQEEQDRFLRIAIGILKDGRSPDAAQVSSVSVPEFFTQSANNRIAYSGK